MTTVNTSTVMKKAENGFDPLKDLFTAQYAKPAGFGNINLRALSPFQRALLVIDGTVTKFIEAYTMEPVEIFRLGQEVLDLPDDHIWLEAPKGEAVITREVLLKGKYSRTVYAYAASLVLPDRLGEEEKNSLDKDGEGLGRILLQNRLETYRDILWYGKEYVDTLPLSIQSLNVREFISRTYRIYTKGKPIMLINEKFPLENNGLPSHH